MLLTVSLLRQRRMCFCRRLQLQRGGTDVGPELHRQISRQVQVGVVGDIGHIVALGVRLFPHQDAVFADFAHHQQAIPFFLLHVKSHVPLFGADDNGRSAKVIIHKKLVVGVTQHQSPLYGELLRLTHKRRNILKFSNIQYTGYKIGGFLIFLYHWLFTSFQISWEIRIILSTLS